MFNAIHNESGLKIDFWILTESDFDRSRFERRIGHSVGGRQCYFTSPEDTIVIKLKWIRESGHAKHVDDIKNMIKFSRRIWIMAISAYGSRNWSCVKRQKSPV